jgi:putative radical SAM enzyme (TIGR03279 family)
MSQGITIENIAPGSLVAEFELEPGDVLLAVNGEPIRDIIDYGFYTSDDELLLEIEKKDGAIWELEIVREEGEPLGLVFAVPVPKQCENACQFCFVDQLPQGLRPSLYVKDEDYRLSFLYGNFVTLTSLQPVELARIKEQRLSPLYISVHATDPEVRAVLLGNTAGPKILDILRELAAAGITMHTQVVLCPGINDGACLERTVRELAALYPWVASLAIVPVGLTCHRQRLPVLGPVTNGYAVAFLETWLPRTGALAEELGEPFLFLADEFFLRANVPFPSLADYGDLPQLENGVGLLPQFLAEAKDVLEQAEPLRQTVVTVVTGVSANYHVRGFLDKLSQKTGVVFHIVAPENTLFGRSVTVAGLVAARDVMASLRGLDLGEIVAIPDVMLKDDEDLFIDSVSLQEVRAALGKDLLVFAPSPAAFYGALRRRLAV